MEPLVSLFLAVLVLFLVQKWWKRASDIRNIPTVGPSAPLVSYIGAFRLVHHAREMLREGYEKYKDGMFKIAMQDRWLVVVNTPELIEEVRKLSDEQANFIDAAHETIEAKHTFGPMTYEDPYYVDIIRSHVFKHSGDLYPDVHDEMIAAFKDGLPDCMSDWTPVPILSVARKIVSRSNNRVFVGFPLCERYNRRCGINRTEVKAGREPEFVNLTIRHTIDVSNTRKILSRFPGFLRGLAVPFVNHAADTFKAVKQHLSPIIRERLASMNEFAYDQKRKPTDLLQRVIDEAQAKNHDLDVMIQNILAIEFVSIHTTSNSFTHALFHLAAQPQYIGPLREEIEPIVKGEGWTKETLGKMHRLDSFLRESQRMNGIGFAHVFRKLLTEVTLSNGITLPASTYVTAPVSAIHHDGELYCDPEVFDPWRFYNLREVSNSPNKYQYVTPSTDYLAFGHGKHACPGRFFAANEIKTMLAHIILRYDVKFAIEGVRPKNEDVFLQTFPASGVHVLFRDRQEA
ncbi:hypothetical protein QCA50_002323 [Cerrena zonata]|uniref:Cytochrome P450 n=1 Tax=Cerrena zonata TaxID=2478898 RepID=A0AAW0GWP7_9APHY